MKTFVTLMCFVLIAAVTANSGYNYQQPRPVVKQNFRSQAPVGGVGIYSPQQALPLASINVPPQPIKQNYIAPAPQYASQYAPQYASQHIEVPAPPPQYIQQQPLAPQPQYVQQQQHQVNAPSQIYNQPAPQFAPAQQSAQFQYNQQPQQQTIISKDIYIHSAPEETEEITSEQGAEIVPIRKNYRIVFIKAPSQNIKFNVHSLKRTQAANEDKTVIYVLSKKPDITTIQNQLSSIQAEQKPHKPEVYFIKYKTQDEANRAQQEIQAQYEALGGSTNVSDEGFAPVTSVIGGGAINAGSAGSISGSGSLNGPNFSGSLLQSASNNNFVQHSSQGSQASASSVSITAQAPSNKYLPAKKK